METQISTIGRKAVVYFLSVLLLFNAYSCTYFIAKKVSSDFEASINNIGEIHKYFIVHDGDILYDFTEISVDSVSFSGNLMPITAPVYYTENRNNRIKETEKDILNEVHVYLREGTEPLQQGYAAIPLTEIIELRIIDKNNGETVASHIIGTLGVAAGVVVFLLIIALLTKSSCPYVYVNNGEAFIFAGETFGGAIGANLARDDYMPLPAIKAVDGVYQLRISNELKERQYTDLAELILVNHTPGQKVLLDKTGEFQVLEKPHGPLTASSYGGENLLPILAASDKNRYLFNDDAYSENGLFLSFKKPADAHTGKLLLTANNTLWFDYLFGEFLEKFGGSFDSYMEKQSKIPSSERLNKMRENNFPLSVYAKQNGQWELVDYLFTVGPLAAREFVIPIDLQKYPGEEIEIKIETGFMFWQIDQIAMDFTPNTDLSIRHLRPLTAFGTGHQDWVFALEKTDGQYMAQERVGEVTELSFAVPPIPDGQVQSAFLHTRGYYELIRDFTGLPELLELNKFKDPSYFSAFSRANYLKVLDKEKELENLAEVSR